ncbi:MAG TPA: 4a-hydroxytetrahydrobiopterin dehydratase [Dongiaceae bacterium]|nr:4a-hydroxytetrahydrobiopterin dehydratase [Dongiaceae bacterium]
MSETNSTALAGKECKPCSSGSQPLQGEPLKKLRAGLQPEWTVVDEHHLERNYSVANFREALDLTNRVGEVAERENHHPDIFLSWGRVKLKLWTHNIDGLSENDFILAAKLDQLR